MMPVMIETTNIAIMLKATSHSVFIVSMLSMSLPTSGNWFASSHCPSPACISAL